MSSRRTPRDPSGRGALLGLRQQLRQEYGDAVPGELIDRVAEETLRELQGARIRDFVPVFAWRRARQRLREQRSSA